MARSLLVGVSVEREQELVSKQSVTSWTSNSMRDGNFFRWVLRLAPAGSMSRGWWTSTVQSSDPHKLLAYRLTYLR